MRKRIPSILRFVALFAFFLALYALTAQRGLGWGDSGEFQHWILNGNTAIFSQPGFSNLHPLYLVIARAVCATPFQVTLLSSFSGALAVAGFYLCSRNAAMAILFGLAHCVWWMSCVAEVYTMSLVFIAAETFCLMRFCEKRSGAWLVALAFFNGLHLELHNIAMLAWPVYAAVALAMRTKIRTIITAAAAFAFGACYWLYALVTRGIPDVLYGAYGTQAMGLLPNNWTLAIFNWALGGLSLAIGFAIFCWSARSRRDSEPWHTSTSWSIAALLVIHFLFWVRYFIISQFTFVLPTVFFLYLLASRRRFGVRAAVLLAAAQIALPIAAYFSLLQIPVPSWYWSHPHRNDAAYFILPWKFHDDSADRCAAEQGGEWSGYAKEKDKEAQ